MIRFTNSEKRQVGKLVGDKEFMAYLADILVILNNNDLLFKNNVKYARAKFMQDGKMTKRSIIIFFNHFDLVPI